MDSFYAPNAYIVMTNQCKVNILYAFNASNNEPNHRITKIVLIADDGVYDNLAIEVLEP